MFVEGVICALMAHSPTTSKRKGTRNKAEERYFQAGNSVEEYSVLYVAGEGGLGGYRDPWRGEGRQRPGGKSLVGDREREGRKEGRKLWFWPRWA